MAAPPKPWEIAGVNRQNYGTGSYDPFSWANGYGCGYDRRPLYRSTVRYGHGGGGGGLAGGAGGPGMGSTSRSRAPPPIPPRADKPMQQPQGSVYPRYNYGFNPYGSISGSFYNPPVYGSYGFGSRFGYGPDYYNNSENSFVRLAEESSRPAFQSIESIVHAVASVSMMLESTYHAVYSSFRAVIGVADHFSRLKNHLSHILTTLSLIRTLRWLCLKTLYLFGIIKENPVNEAAWSAASKDVQDILNGDNFQRSRSSWPILMFFGVVFGAPWLIWRLLSSLTGQASGSSEWKGKEDNHYIGVALFDFEGDGDQELSFQTGQQIYVAPRSYQPRIRGWLRASVNGKKIGLVPANYIKVKALRKGVPTPLLDTNPEADGVPATSTSMQNEQDLENPEVINQDQVADDCPGKTDTEKI